MFNDVKRYIVVSTLPTPIPVVQLMCHPPYPILKQVARENIGGGERTCLDGETTVRTSGPPYSFPL